jgi:hypothetical protein
MKVSGGEEHGWFTQDWPVCALTTTEKSLRSNFSVDLPTLFTSLQELPVFQTHLATPLPAGHEKVSGTVHTVLILPPCLMYSSGAQANAPVALGKKCAFRSD